MRKVIAILVLFVMTTLAHGLPQSAAFYYGDHVPVSQLQLFNTVVVDPAYVLHPRQNETPKSHWYAYVSLGEVSKKRSYFKQIKRQWVLGVNKHWDSKVLDPANPGLRKFFVNTVFKKLWDQGYHGFFLDTMDSYYLVSKNKAIIKRKQQGLIKLIQAIKRRYPKATLILNRGFELLPTVHKLVNGIAAESLYYGYNMNLKQYMPVPKKSREWLLGQFKKAKSYGLDIYAIDYLPLTQQKKAQADAKKIMQHGFIPWVSNIQLTGMGVSSIHVYPRQVMMVYSVKGPSEKITSAPLRYLSAPLNYMGYYPRLYNARKSLPGYPLANRIAGVVVWLEDDEDLKLKSSMAWFQRVIKQKIPILFIYSLGYYQEHIDFFKKLGLTNSSLDEKLGKLHVGQVDKQFVGFEVKPKIESRDFLPIKASQSRALLKIRSVSGKDMDAAAITPWGGYVLKPYMMKMLANKQERYIINPFKLLKEALRLPDIPIPDVTTENGRRILIGHIDGDAFYSRSEWPRGPYAGESLLRTILDKYRIPTTVSVVEGEIGKAGLKPKESPKLEAIARKIFQLPWVEIANHSYSHPFYWHTSYKNTGKIIPGDSTERLNIPGYRFSLKRDIIGSTNYINNELAPPGKKCKIFLWTGDTNPPAKAVEMTYKIGLLNMNSGNTIISHSYPSLAAVWGMGMYHGGYLQIFAPIQNENMYTGLWTGPFYGFKRVIETFQMTDKPRRLKPIDIYYHFYSATKVSALKALDAVYDWSVKQSVTPEFSSDYIKKAMDFYHLAVAKYSDTWLIHGSGSIHEFRQPNSGLYPVLNSTVIGVNIVNGSHYVHTTQALYHQIQWQSHAPTGIYLHDSNGILKRYQQQGAVHHWTIQSYLPLVANFSNGSSCHFSVNGKAVEAVNSGNLTVIKQVKEGRFELKAEC